MSELQISPLNSAEIQQVLAYLDLKGSFLREIVQPDYKSLIFTFYRKDQQQIRLLCDLHAQKSALYPLKKEDKRKNLNLRFMQMLRAHCVGGYVEEVFQYHTKKIVVFHVKHAGKSYHLCVRL